MHKMRSFKFYVVLGGDVDVGILAIENQEYDPHVWWKTNKGVRAVIGEGIAYLYARFFFWPVGQQGG